MWAGRQLGTSSSAAAEGMFATSCPDPTPESDILGMSALLGGV